MIDQNVVKEKWEVKEHPQSIDVWFGDKNVIKCPKCSRYLTNIVTDHIVEKECNGCGKKFRICLQLFIELLDKTTEVE